MAETEKTKCSILSLMARLETAIDYHIESKLFAHNCELHGKKEACVKIMEFNNKASDEYKKFRDILWECLKEEKKT